LRDLFLSKSLFCSWHMKTLLFFFQSKLIFGVGVVLLFFPILSFSQTTLVAELTGNPLNTTGWTYLGGGGGGYINGDEFVFTDDLTAQQGAIYFSEPFNLNQCKKWRIEFEARLWGNGTPTYGNADGVAFWYLENPPDNFTSGGGIGMPASAKGIMVVMDTFNNSTEGSQSELQVYYGQLFANPYEDNTPGMSYFNTLPLGVNVRNSNYQPVVIEWDAGQIVVTIAGVQICSYSPTPYNGVENLTDGYFGFSGSTGAGTDRQSIRNVHVYMDVVELNTANTQIAQCDANGDGYAQFDLTSQENTIIDNPGNYDIEYYSNQLNMSNGVEISDPEHYVNETPGGQTVYVIVRNSEDCFEIAEIELIVNSMPQQQIIETQYFCDDDGDGEITVNLNDYQSQFIIGSLIGLTFHYYTDAALTNEIPPADWANYTINTFPHSVWITADKTFENGDTCSTNPKEIIFDLGENLPVNGEIFPLSENVFCINANENIMLDLTEVEDDFTNETGVTYQYYETEAQAHIGGNDFIPDPENYPVNSSGSVYVRLEKPGFCISIVRIDFEIGLNPEANPVAELQSGCEDDNDGFAEFDLNDAIPGLVTDDTGLTFTYYLSQNDAINHNNPQSSTVFIPTGTSEIYWVVISSGTCETISEIHLEAIEGLEGVEQQIDPILVCDDNFDGIYTVDLTQAEDGFMAVTTGITFTYYSDSGFTNQIPASQTGNYTITGTTTIWLIISNGDCSASRSFQVGIRDSVPHNTPPYELDGICEETEIDLTEIESQITGNPAVTISYFLTESGAENHSGEIINPETYLPETDSGTLYVRLEQEGFCSIILPFEYELSPLPDNPFTDFPKLCPGEEVTLDAGDEYPDQNYLWEWDGGSQAGPEITITQPGNYTLTITSNNNCSRVIPIVIAQPEPPVITNVVIGSNYLIVEATGHGPFEYSLDGVLWQSVPRFDNLIPGEEYTVFVRENGCSPVAKNVVILFVPNFISPNNDGYNDTWSLRGLELFQQCNVKIFDRYGKIFVDSEPQDGNVIWNGKYKGDPVPSGDYWYIIITKDENFTGMKYVGHISVRNRD